MPRDTSRDIDNRSGFQKNMEGAGGTLRQEGRQVSRGMKEHTGNLKDLAGLRGSSGVGRGLNSTLSPIFGGAPIEEMDASGFGYDNKFGVGGARARQEANLGQLREWAAGRGPSAAQAQLRSGLASAQSQATAAGRSQVGGNSAALGQRNAAGARAQLAGEAATNATRLRAAEQQQAMGMYTQATESARNQAASEQGMEMGAITQNNATNAGIRQGNQAANSGALGKAGKFVGAVISDELTKDKIEAGIQLTPPDRARAQAWARAEMASGRSPRDVAAEIASYAGDNSWSASYGTEAVQMIAQQPQAAPQAAPAAQRPRPADSVRSYRGYGGGDDERPRGQHNLRGQELSAGQFMGRPSQLDPSGRLEGYGHERVMRPTPGSFSRTTDLGAGATDEQARAAGDRAASGLRDRIDATRRGHADRADGDWSPGSNPGQIARKQRAIEDYIRKGIGPGDPGWDAKSGFNPYATGGMEREANIAIEEMRDKHEARAKAAAGKGVGERIGDAFTAAYSDGDEPKGVKAADTSDVTGEKTKVKRPRTAQETKDVATLKKKEAKLTKAIGGMSDHRAKPAPSVHKASPAAKLDTAASRALDKKASAITAATAGVSTRPKLKAGPKLQSPKAYRKSRGSK